MLYCYGITINVGSITHLFPMAQHIPGSCGMTIISKAENVETFPSAPFDIKVEVKIEETDDIENKEPEVQQPSEAPIFNYDIKVEIDDDYPESLTHDPKTNVEETREDITAAPTLESDKGKQAESDKVKQADKEKQVEADKVKQADKGKQAKSDKVKEADKGKQAESDKVKEADKGKQSESDKGNQAEADKVKQADKGNQAKADKVKQADKGNQAEADKEKQVESISTLIKNSKPSNRKRPHIQNECCICLKTFQSASLLVIHLKTHYGTSPHQTKTVKRDHNEIFNVKQNYQDLKRISAEIHTSHECSVCQMKLKSDSQLVKHLRTHVDKPHKCCVCQMQFSSRRAVNRHKISHTDEKPYECKICHKRYVRNDSLTSHLCTQSAENLRS